MAIYFGQDIETKLVEADDYFSPTSHILAYDWAKFLDDEKKASLNQAEREVNLYLGISLETEYSSTSFPLSDWCNFRPDYAIFEHAFFILDNTARTSISSSGAKQIESEDYQKEERSSGVPMSPQAMRYLRMNRLQITRG